MWHYEIRLLQTEDKNEKKCSDMEENSDLLS